MNWCLGNTTNSGTVCNGTTYSAGGSFGIDQTTNNEVTLNAVWSPDITIKTNTGISSVSLNGESCTSTTGCTITGLANGQDYTLIATPATGYSFTSWDAVTSGSILDTTLATTTYTVGNTKAAITPNATPNQYTITLDANGGAGGSSTTTATYDSTTLALITNPTKADSIDTKTVSGFTMGTGASSATVTWPSSGCTSASNCKSTKTTTYAFNGWYKESSATNKIASNATTPVLQANTSYTDASGKWTSTSGQTLYAGWTASGGTYNSITLPSISKTGYACSWNTASAGTGTNYASGVTITPSSNLTLYGYCVANTYSLSIIFAGSGVSSVEVKTASGTSMGKVSTSGGSVSNLSFETSYYLYPVFATNYELSSWANTGSYGRLSSTTAINPTFTMATGNGEVTITGKASCIATFPGGTMQAFSSSGLCDSVTSGALSDSRDNQNYTVAKINGNWWMTKNLAIGCSGSSRVTRSLTPSDSNVSSTWSTGSAGNLTDDTSGSYTAAYMQCSSTYGAWYNYMAATAGTISGDSNQVEASASICPKGWRLPTQSEQSGITSYASSFSPATGGQYNEGRLESTGYGLLWSSTAASSNRRYNLSYNVSSLNTSSNSRYIGLYVRCIKA